MDRSLRKLGSVGALALCACTSGGEPASAPRSADAVATPALAPAPVADAPASVASAAPSSVAAAPPSPPSPPEPPAPPEPPVRDDLYLAPKAGGLVRIPGTGAELHAVAGVTGPVRALAADAGGRVYAVGPGSVHRIDDGVVTGTLPAVEVGSAGALHAVSERDLWLLGSEGLAHFDGDGWTVTPVAELGLEGPRDVTVDTQGRVWLLGRAAVVRRDGDRSSPVTLLRDARGLHGFVDWPGQVLSISHLSGVDHVLGETWTQVNLAFVFGANVTTGRTFNTIAVDHGGGTTTVVSPQGVTAGTGAERRMYEVGDEKHPVTELRGVEVDGRGRSWVIADGGLLLLDPADHEPTWIGPGAIRGVEGEVAHLLALGQGPPLPPLVDPGRGAVKGVLQHRGQPLAGATIELCSFPDLGGSKGRPCEFTEHIFGATTAADGSFEVQDVLPGRYRMAVHEASKDWRYLPVEKCCLATRPGAPQDLGIIDTRSADRKGW